MQPLSRGNFFRDVVVVVVVVAKKLHGQYRLRSAVNSSVVTTIVSRTVEKNNCLCYL